MSEASNSDLFWAMRGAGQNFGIVTKFKYKILDYPNSQEIFYATYYFTEDKLEALFEYLNKLLDNGTLPRDVNAYVVLRLKPHISPKVSCIWPSELRESILMSHSLFLFTTSTTSETASKLPHMWNRSSTSAPYPAPMQAFHTSTSHTSPSKQASGIQLAWQAFRQKSAFQSASRCIT